MNHQSHCGKRIRLAALMLTLLLMLSGCGANKEEKYSTYVRAYITAAYLGDGEEYVKCTNSSIDSARQLYDHTVDRLARSLCSYYNLEITDDSELYAKMLEIAKSVYAKAKFEIVATRKEDSGYYVDVTISSIDFLSSNYEKMKAYVDSYNARVDAGEFNDIEKEEYERTFASGILDFLQESTAGITYREPETISVKISEGNGGFSLGAAELTAIDKLIIAVTE